LAEPLFEALLAEPTGASLPVDVAVFDADALAELFAALFAELAAAEAAINLSKGK